MSHDALLYGQWVGVEPRMNPTTGQFEFDWTNPETPIHLSLAENGRSEGATRFTQMGTMADNTIMPFRTRLSDFQLMIGFREDGLRQIITYTYVLLDNNTMLISTDGAPSDSAYGQISFENSYDHLLIEETTCHHQFQADSPIHTSPTKYLQHEQDRAYGTYWELQYEAKSVMGNQRTDTLWYFPAQQIFIRPPKYMLRRI